MPTPPMFFELPKQLTGYELNPVRSYFSVTVSEATINYFKTPSFENVDNDTETQSANVTPTYDTTQSFRGRYSRKITISSTAANYFAKRASAGSGILDTPGQAAAFSCYVLSPTGESFKLEMRSSIDAYAAAFATSDVFQNDGTWKRVFIKFTLPAGANSSTTYECRLVRTNATTNPYYTDAWQLEAKAYPTSYCDGNESGCVWLGPEANSYSQRASNSFGGREYNLKTDLNLMVTSYVGTDMPPLQHTSTKRALAGGDFYQRSLPTYRVISVTCNVIQPSLMTVQQVKEQLLLLFGPDLLNQVSKSLLLTFQNTDAVGNPIGKIIDAQVQYLAGLEGNQDNNQSETFTIQFSEYTPPSIQERQEIAVVPSFQNSTSPGRIANFRQALNHSNWITTSSFGSQLIDVVYQTTTDQVYVLGSDFLVGPTASLYANPLPYRNGVSVTTLATANGSIRALAGTKYDTDLWVGGSFTSIGGTPANFIAHETALSTFAALAAGGPNGDVYSILQDRSGKLYVAGLFTTPNNRLTRYNPSTPAWESIGGTGLDSDAYCLAIGLDGAIYVGGAFLNANGVAVNRIAKYDPVTNTYSALGSGMNNVVMSLIVGPDGKLYAGGDFTTAGGVSCSGIAVWNGNQWSPLGAGLNFGGGVNSVVKMSFAPDGSLYVSGWFTGTADGALSFPSHVAKWTGSTWLPVCLTIDGTQSEKVLISPQSDILVVGGGGGTVTFETTTTVTYTGSAGTKPRIVFRGPGTLYKIENLTTNMAIYFNYTLLAGEVAVLQLDGSSPTFTSNYFGNILGKILPGSNTINFGLNPGANDISCYIAGTTSGTTAIEMYYHNRHWGFAASGGA